MKAPLGYEGIKALAKARGEPITDLLALDRKNDPFFTGSRAHVRDAEWFADWWRRLGYDGQGGAHLRGVHYKLVSQATQPEMPGGEPYLNTDSCWDYLCQAAGKARYLGLVHHGAFVDRRNPSPQLFEPGMFYGREARRLGLPVRPEWSLPSILLTHGYLDLPRIEAPSYYYTPAQQPYLVEIWVEKSTMNHVLLPVCQRYGANLITSLGFQSIPAVIDLLRRAESCGKPARVLYISDFDPAGSFMPDAVARQIEYWRYRLGIKAEVKLQPIALTRDQVIEYRLPSIPIKESDLRANGFRGRYGREATELDALEALYPSTLARIVEEAIKPYRDDTLESRWDDAWGEAEALADDATEWVADQCEDWRSLQREVSEIQAEFEKRVAALDAELQARLAPYQERLQTVRQAVQQTAEEAIEDFILPDPPEPEIDEPDEDDWLFDSNRSYMDQLWWYKERRQ